MKAGFLFHLLMLFLFFVFARFRVFVDPDVECLPKMQRDATPFINTVVIPGIMSGMHFVALLLYSTEYLDFYFWCCENIIRNRRREQTTSNNLEGFHFLFFIIYIIYKLI